MKKGVQVLAPETEQAVESLSTPANGGDPHLVTLSSGVVLRVKAVPPSLLADIVARFPSPEPPVVYIADKGRDEENPSDPVYLKRVAETNAAVSKAMSDAVILMGTALESAPKQFPGPEDPTWLEELQLMGYDRGSARARYLAWVKFKAGPELADYQAIWKAVGRLTGVTEQDTQSAVRRFSGGARRNRHH